MAVEIQTTQEAINRKAGITGSAASPFLTEQEALNRLAGTVGLTKQDAMYRILVATGRLNIPRNIPYQDALNSRVDILPPTAFLTDQEAANREWIVG